jgi:hypothetical protein
MTFEENMALARKRVADMDAIDGDSSENRRACAPADKRSPLSLTLNTIWCALEAGLRCPGTGAEYDALVMLEDLTGRASRRSNRN